MHGLSIAGTRELKTFASVTKRKGDWIRRPPFSSPVKAHELRYTHPQRQQMHT